MSLQVEIIKIKFCGLINLPVTYLLKSQRTFPVIYLNIYSFLSYYKRHTISVQ